MNVSKRFRDLKDIFTTLLIRKNLFIFLLKILSPDDNKLDLYIILKTKDLANLVKILDRYWGGLRTIYIYII